MKFRFAPVKRPLLALTAFAAVAVAMVGAIPAHAVSFNNLSFQGTEGRIRVRPVFQYGGSCAPYNSVTCPYPKGSTALQAGNPSDDATNPNRTVGDVPAVLGGSQDSPCDGVTQDCLRTLLNNDASVNPSASNGDTKYHGTTPSTPGDDKILVSDISGFRTGDTILIGSPYCNFAYLGLTCKAFKSGFGTINEQPAGEIAHVVNGLAADDHGEGELDLAEPLTLDHLEGSTVRKLPTLYQGQQFRVDINHSDLLACGLHDPDTSDDTTIPDPTPAAYSCSANDVAVRAWLVPPQGSHNPAFARRPLTLSYGTTSTSFVLAASCGDPLTPCGSGFSSFYIPKEVTGTATRGTTFSNDTDDTWYTVIVEARANDFHGPIVADGVSRFKLNPISIQNLKAENATAPGVNQFFPTSTVDISGVLRDNTSAAALASRPVEDVQVGVDVKSPNSTSHYLTTSCINNNPANGDVCGGNAFGSQPEHHGGFSVTYGGPGGGGCSLDIFDNIAGCNGGAIGGPFDLIGGLTDTLNTGTYDVTARVLSGGQDLSPQVKETTQFIVQIF